MATAKTNYPSASKPSSTSNKSSVSSAPKTSTTPVAKTTSSPTLTQQTLNEIARKAQSGIALTNPTQQSSTVYETIRKAQNGIALTNPTADKLAIYDKYKSSSPANSTVQKPEQQIIEQPQPQEGLFNANAYVDQLNAAYDQQRQAQLLQLQNQRDKAVGQINQQKAELAPAYASKRNEADVVNAQNTQKLREVMANNGLTNSGENVTSQVALNSARQGALNQLNLQEQQQSNDFERRIADLNNPTEINSLMAAIDSERMKSIADAQRYASERAYQQSRDGVADNKWNQTFDYQKSIDNRNFDYQKSIDNRNFNYQVGRDKVGDSQWDKTFNQSERARLDQKAWREFTYNNMSASEKATLAQNSSQFGEEMAWKLFELNSSNETQITMNKAQIEAYQNGNFNKGTDGYLSQAGLGELSRNYESSGNPAVIANTKGDIGGKSYGSYQLTVNSGHAQKFANMYGGSLKGLKAGTAAFDSAWKAEALKNPEKFATAQHNYIQVSHFAPAASKFKAVTGIDANKAPKAVQDMIWSIGVQHGAGGAATIFKNAGISPGMSWENIIKRVYSERMKVDKYFASSPKNIKNSVYNRFQNELSDALKMLKG